jgi:hypothetical protein
LFSSFLCSLFFSFRNTNRAIWKQTILSNRMINYMYEKQYHHIPSPRRKDDIGVFVTSPSGFLWSIKYRNLHWKDQAMINWFKNQRRQKPREIRTWWLT